jgi:hypothetical protein
MDDFDNFINADNSDDEAAFVSTPGGSRHRAGTGSSARKCKSRRWFAVQRSPMFSRHALDYLSGI